MPALTGMPDNISETLHGVGSYWNRDKRTHRTPVDLVPYNYLPPVNGR